MSNDIGGKRMKITIAPREGVKGTGWIDVISTDMVGAYLNGVFATGNGEVYVVGIEPTLHAVGRHPDCPSKGVI